MNKFERLRLSNHILRVCIEHVLEKYADGLLYVERENCIKFCENALKLKNIIRGEINDKKRIKSNYY